MRGLELALVNRQYAAAYDLRHIRACVDGYDQVPSQQSGQVYAAHGRAVKDDHGLHDHRRAAEYLYVSGEDKVDDFHHGTLEPRAFRRDGDGAHDADEQPDNRAGNGGGDGDQQRDARSLEKHGPIGGDERPYPLEKAAARIRGIE